MKVQRYVWDRNLCVLMYKSMFIFLGSWPWLLRTSSPPLKEEHLDWINCKIYGAAVITISCYATHDLKVICVCLVHVVVATSRLVDKTSSNNVTYSVQEADQYGNQK